MLNKDKDLKLYYSIAEAAEIVGVSKSMLRFWEKEFPQLHPKKVGRGVRQYTKEDIETLKLIHHLVKEEGLTTSGANRRLKANKNDTERHFEIVQRLKAVRNELVEMMHALDAFTYEEVDKLKSEIGKLQGPLTPPSGPRP